MTTKTPKGRNRTQNGSGTSAGRTWDHGMRASATPIQSHSSLDRDGSPAACDRLSGASADACSAEYLSLMGTPFPIQGNPACDERNKAD